MYSVHHGASQFAIATVGWRNLSPIVLSDTFRTRKIENIPVHFHHFPKYYNHGKQKTQPQKVILRAKLLSKTMIEKALYNDHQHQQLRQSPNDHPLMCKNCIVANSNNMTEYPEESSACAFGSRRRPFPTLHYPRIRWNSNSKCQGCMGKEQTPMDLNNAVLLDDYATTRMLDLAAEEELVAAQASGDLDRIREAMTILDFNKRAS